MGRLATLTVLALTATALTLPGVSAASAPETASGPDAAPGPEAAAEIEEVTQFGSNPGALRMFRYTPDNLSEGRPVVIALHGCTQDAVGYGTNSGWIELADRWGFTVVLPQQESANNANGCFNWFEQADTDRDTGEAASVAQMRQRAIDDAAADPQRVYVSGLSAGGAMTATMLATYPEQYAGGGIVAGLPYRCASTLPDAFTCMNPGKDQTPQQWGDLVRAASAHEGARPTVSLWHGDADTTVAPANMRESVEQWTDVHGTDTTPDVEDTVAGYPHAEYHDGSGRAVVETVTIPGMNHGQPVDPGTGEQQCGQAADYMLDVDVCAAYQMGTTWGLAAQGR
ncbi:extracellular catalytic domain type 1 short-chain-length polyhydroxyalkanoate depolymerase [Allosaccharopolyspora coralli]|nr:PHB depolymerase family esterase [Allosaccharopolyspora coralli]